MDTRHLMVRNPFRVALFSLVFGIAFVSSTVFAQAAPPGSAPTGIMKQTKVSTGTTDIATSGFEGSAFGDATKKDDATEAKILGGAMGASGNSRSIAATGSMMLRLRREANQGTAAAALNYGRSPEDPTDRESDMRTSVENYQGRLRYDRFITDRFTVFGALSLRRDRFQDLNLRLNIDPGVGYYFIADPKQQLWGELGYDFQYDVRTQKAVNESEADDDIPDIDKTQVRHSARLFLGYANNLSENANVTTGLEYLQGIPKTTNWRLNWDVALTSKIAGNFSLAAAFTLRYDHNPLPTVRHTDTITSLSLVYQLI
jgi:putative salt-induced outer membrane protein YdiY